MIHHAEQWKPTPGGSCGGVRKSAAQKEEAGKACFFFQAQAQVLITAFLIVASKSQSPHANKIKGKGQEYSRLLMG